MPVETTTVSRMNQTLETATLSEAVAVTVTVWGVVKVLLAAGAVIEMEGVVVSMATVTGTAALVELLPMASKAVAVQK